MSLFDALCGNLDFEDGSTAPFSALLHLPDLGPTIPELSTLALLSLTLPPSPLPPLGPIITPVEDEERE